MGGKDPRTDIRDPELKTRNPKGFPLSLTLTLYY